MSEEKLSKKEYEEYIFLKQLRNNELAKIVKNKMYKQKLTADNMIVLQEKQLNKQKELLDKIKEYIKESIECSKGVLSNPEHTIVGKHELIKLEIENYKRILELLEEIE